MNNEVKLPLKRVAMSDVDFFRPPAAGGKPTIFEPVTPLVRARLAGEVATAAATLSPALRSLPGAAGVLRVSLKDAALAKSHRPTALFESAKTRVRAALVVTIADLDRRENVYSSVVAEMNRLGWVSSDVRLRTQLRPR